MIVLYINRSLKFGGYSFEELFKTIKTNLQKFTPIDFYDKTCPSFIKNIITLKKIKTDIYHITGGIGYYALFLPKKKTILTIHDTNHYENDLRGIKKWLFGWIIYKLPILNVKYATVVSEHTKLRLIKLFNINESKIKVIPNCYPDNFNAHPKLTLNNVPKILQIGTKENKNIYRLIEAIKGLNVELTIVGKLNSKLETTLKTNQINYIHKFGLTQEEIKLEYINTDIVVFVSLCEGFGLPIIEAQSIGRVVITSNKCSMPEVANDAAHIVDPFDISQIRIGIEKIITDDEYRNDLIKKGFENCKKYSPSKITSLYEELYLTLIQKN